MKTIPTLAILFLISCKTAFVSDYSFHSREEVNDCFYRIELDEKSFYELSPIVHSHTESVMVDDQWVSTDVDHIAGYGVRNEAYNSFLYLMEEGLNPLNGREECGIIYVRRLQHEFSKNPWPSISLLTLFIPNIFGMPVKVSEAHNTYLFEVTNEENEIIYREKHTGSGKASLGLYYGYLNAEAKADYDATHQAIADFLNDFQAITVD